VLAHFAHLAHGSPDSFGLDCYSPKVVGKLGNIGAEIPKLYGISDK